MKLTSIFALSSLMASSVAAFSALQPQRSVVSTAASSTALFSSEMDRRSALLNSASMAAAAMATGFVVDAQPASAASVKQVVVAGATGQTGRRVLERLAAQPGLTVVGGVRNVDKASKALGESSTVVRGAMVQQVASVDTSKVDLKHLDIVNDSPSALQETLKGADALVIAVGFVPSNPLKMNEEAHKVDNVGTCRLIDAAKAAGVSKVVMVSSILTNGRAWGQEKSPGFVVTNAFGQVLDEKIQAENYLRKSGMDYTIVRPGGLKAKPPTGPLVISGEDTLNSGEVSRDLVADVCVASLTDPKASNKVLEIIEDDGKPPQVFNGLNM
mmetsp:Transcript_63402/g.182527  ORF Transcript_63402/g.182527 Transcript_63402/m.182527 type:complete len:328 (+) Transcript_63402:112-1095(+)|eukprot:CAMPEP_0176134774 /NCGR_PEP_ID=MMETSP0120_2-20121206/68351_1 /TAXON_ID=160619 /ORGANISM="Kryptoperidinium foliaceum, Strain CCMP 1326" /LENGTH=327 /DNA_ID=CAMNT_0017470435 /DNA_START=108 /DNA_END=1091 /DNA_ORIENTATION=+